VRYRGWVYREVHLPREARRAYIPGGIPPRVPGRHIYQYIPTQGHLSGINQGGIPHQGTPFGIKQGRIPHPGDTFRA